MVGASLVLASPAGAGTVPAGFEESTADRPGVIGEMMARFKGG